MAAVSNPLNTTCFRHEENQLDWFCDTCSVLICLKCSSYNHRGHNTTRLSERTPLNKVKIKAFINEVEENSLTRIQNELNSSEDSISGEQFENVIQEVENRGQELRRGLDTYIQQIISELKQLKDENGKIRRGYKMELERKLDQLKENVEQCKETIQTGTDLQVFFTMNGVDKAIILPRKPVLGTAIFSPVGGSLGQIFGKVTLTRPTWLEVSSDGQNSLPQQTNRGIVYPPLSGSSEPQQRSLPDTGSTAPQDYPTVPYQSSPPRYEDFQHTNVLPELRSMVNISSISPTKTGDAWTSYWKSDNLTRLTSQGEVVQSMQIPVVVKDISVSPCTNNLWVCSDKDNSVLELTSTTLTHRFRTKDEPKALCITVEDLVLIGTKHRITKYTTKGKWVSSSKAPLLKKSTVYSPQKISQCPVTENIAVVDRDRSGEGGQDKPKIVVLNVDLEELFRYGQSQYKGARTSKHFNPWDVAYDRMGNLVVADGGNCCLHLLGGNGAYLRVLHTDTAL
ncbi:E3 ubiquitin-protein ligase TRIM71-like [Argopecten irradians]|uniref:E3 ubiquitin-protein ligase TRIM71-like n=1 Tax=Argopecten irradians TaxID=31199 RepID=UPI003715A7B3